MAAAWLLVALMAACERDFESLYAEETPSEVVWGRGDGACERCVHARCAPEAADCAGDGACRAQAACLQSCSDPDCAAECVRDGEAEPLSCWREACFDDCWMERKWADPTELLLGGRMRAECGACFDRECQDELATCTHESCVQELGCYATCRDPSCMHDCLKRTEGDKALACLRGSCVEECDIGQRFDCVGKYAHPLGVDEPVKVDLVFEDYFERFTPTGLEVRKCTESAVTCPSTEEPVAVVDGRASFTFPATPDMGVGAQAYFRVRGEGIVPARYYAPFPFRGDQELLLATLSQKSLAPFFDEAATTALKPERGAIVAVARDCMNDTAPFLQVKILEGDEHTFVSYVDGTAIDVTKKETDPNGRALLVNVPPGWVTLQAYANDGKDLVIQRRIGVEGAIVPDVKDTAPLTSVWLAPMQVQ
jgi:hypothetical protein